MGTRSLSRAPGKTDACLTGQAYCGYHRHVNRPPTPDRKRILTRLFLEAVTVFCALGSLLGFLLKRQTQAHALQADHGPIDIADSLRWVAEHGRILYLDEIGAIVTLGVLSVLFYCYRTKCLARPLVWLSLILIAPGLREICIVLGLIFLPRH